MLNVSDKFILIALVFRHICVNGVLNMFKKFFAITILLCGLSACVAPVKERGLLPGASATKLDLRQAKLDFPVYQFTEHSVALGSDQLYAVSATRPDARATVLFFGGNQYSIEKWSGQTLGYYQNIPVNVVLVDHLGYGASTGTPTFDGMFAGAAASYTALKSWPELGSLPVIVHGYSIGSFLAGHVAEKFTLDGLVLEGSATTTEEWLKVIPRGLSRIIFPRFEIDDALKGRGNLALMAHLDEPILIVVGNKDTQTPALLSEKLYAAIPSTVRKRLVKVPKGTHLNSAWGAEFRDAFTAQFLVPLKR